MILLTNAYQLKHTEVLKNNSEQQLDKLKLSPITILIRLIRLIRLSYFKTLLLVVFSVCTESLSSTTASDTDEADFFYFASSRSTPSHKHLEFLNDTNKQISMLEKHPEVKQLFIRYNTCIPSSAPVERLFSPGSLVLAKRRNRLSDKLFEMLLLLKVNKRYWQ